jgi:hypothetical protein
LHGKDDDPANVAGLARRYAMRSGEENVRNLRWRAVLMLH